MSTYTIRPNNDVNTYPYANVINQAGQTSTPSTLMATAVSDSSDSSYMRFTAGAAQSHLAQFNLQALSLAATEKIIQYRIVARFRNAGAAAGTTVLNVQPMDSSGNSGAVETFSGPGTAFTTFTGAWRTLAPDGTTPTAANLTQVLVSYPANGATLTPDTAEVWMEVQTNVAPTATITAPSASVTNTSAPAVTFTYADTESNPQVTAQLKVFSAAQYGITGFDPNTSPSTYDSGVVTTTATTLTSGALQPATYKFYIQVSDAYQKSAWASTAALVVNPDTENAPLLTVTNDDPNGRVALTVQGQDNIVTLADSSLETGLGSWVNQGNATVARNNANPAANGSWYLQLTPVAASTRMDAITATGTNGYPVLANQWYQFRVRLRITAATARTVVCFINWYKSDGSASSITVQTQVVNTVSVNNITWSAAFGTVVQAPSDAAFAAIQISYQNPATTSELLLADSFGIIPVPSSSASSSWDRGGLVPNQKYTIQRSVDGGNTWTTVRTLALVNGVWSTTGFVVNALNQTFTTYDYEVPRRVTAIYRVKVASSGSDGWSGESAWTQAAAVVTGSTPCVWIKDPINPARNVAAVMDQHSISKTRSESQGAHYAMGRADPIVVHGTVHLGAFQVVLFFTNDAAYNAWLTLQDSQRTLLLQSPYGDQYARMFYFTIDPDVQVEMITNDRQTTAQPYRVTFTAREAVAP